jgi:hypothetical protein
LVAQRLATEQNDQVEEETLEQLAKTNLLKTFEMTGIKKKIYMFNDLK